MTVEEHQKAIGQFNLALTEVLSVFCLHGLDVYIPAVKQQITVLALQLNRRLNGEDTPYNPHLK
jgi:hypothetical protein